LTRRSSPETPAFHSTKSKTLKESFKTPHLKLSYFIFLKDLKTNCFKKINYIDD